MKKLEHLILDRLDDSSLYSLHLNYPSLKIDEEWKRRLLSCDPEFYLPLLDFLYTQNIEKSLSLKQGLYGLRKCFLWKIGVVYDFRTGQVKSLEIRLGNIQRRYQYEGVPILFSWLDANENKMLLREIISSNTKSSQISVKLDKEKSDEVRDLILDHKFINIDVAIIEATHKTFRTFPREHPLPGGEEFVVYPQRIYNQNKSIQIYDDEYHIGENVSFFNVPITFSQEVEKYLSIISQQ